ncbi:MAG: hypothetical protein JSS02_08150 [Planctomycetes bacterium]|nr:hypothetical protein [Planctomycetota bacterium]
MTEMLVVISVVSVFVGLAGMTIHRLLAAEQEVTRMARYATSVTRLSRSFREDLHAARQVEIAVVEPGQPQSVLVTLGSEHAVRYEFDRHLATRMETQAGQVTHRDAFPLAPQSQLMCRWLESGRQVRLDLQVATRSSARADEPALRQLQVDVVVGRDHRFAMADPAKGGTP